MIPALAAFEGTWALTRRITDRRGGQAGRMEGEATFTPDDKGLIYHEKGHLVLGGGAPVLATRSYLWRAAPGGGIAISFDDGRAFHAIDPGAGGAGPEARHWCDPDTYRVAYDFALWPRWTATWVVSGPAKDYTMVSAYAPRGAAP